MCDRRSDAQAPVGRPHGVLVTVGDAELLRLGDGDGRSTSCLACRSAACGNVALDPPIKIAYESWRLSRAAAPRMCWSATRKPG